MILLFVIAANIALVIALLRRRVIGALVHSALSTANSVLAAIRRLEKRRARLEEARPSAESEATTRAPESAGAPLTARWRHGLLLVFSVALSLTRAHAEQLQTRSRPTSPSLTTVSSRVGTPLDKNTVDKDVEAIRGMGFFGQVDKEIPYSSGRMILVYRVQERPRVSKVLLEGMKELRNTDPEIKESLKVHPEGIFDPELAEETKKAIRRVYQSKGYLDADVAFGTIQHHDNTVDVVFDISEGPVVEVAQISFIGNSALRADKLLSIMKTSTHCVFSFLTGSGAFDPAKLDDDVHSITNLYRNRGYLDVHVEPTLARHDHDKSLSISIAITEGQAYRVGGIAIEGGFKPINNALRRELTLRKGDFFSPSKLQYDTLTLAIPYSDQGYGYVQVDPRTAIDLSSHLVDLTFMISPGRQILVDRINIYGNSNSPDSLIRHEMLIQEQEPYSVTKIRESKVSIDRLAIFDDISFRISPAQEPDRVNVDVTVRESEMIRISSVWFVWIVYILAALMGTMAVAGIFLRTYVLSPPLSRPEGPGLLVRLIVNVSPEVVRKYAIAAFVGSILFSSLEKIINGQVLVIDVFEASLIALSVTLVASRVRRRLPILRSVLLPSAWHTEDPRSLPARVEQNRSRLAQSAAAGAMVTGLLASIDFRDVISDFKNPLPLIANGLGTWFVLKFFFPLDERVHHGPHSGLEPPTSDAPGDGRSYGSGSLRSRIVTRGLLAFTVLMMLHSAERLIDEGLRGTQADQLGTLSLYGLTVAIVTYYWVAATETRVTSPIWRATLSSVTCLFVAITACLVAIGATYSPSLFRWSWGDGDPFRFFAIVVSSLLTKLVDATKYSILAAGPAALLGGAALRWRSGIPAALRVTLALIPVACFYTWLLQPGAHFELQSLLLNLVTIAGWGLGLWLDPRTERVLNAEQAH